MDYTYIISTKKKKQCFYYQIKKNGTKKRIKESEAPQSVILECKKEFESQTKTKRKTPVKTKFTGNENTDVIILRKLDGVSLIQMCNTNKYIRSLCTKNKDLNDKIKDPLNILNVVINKLHKICPDIITDTFHQLGPDHVEIESTTVYQFIPEIDGVVENYMDTPTKDEITRFKVLTKIINEIKKAIKSQLPDRDYIIQVERFNNVEDRENWRKIHIKVNISDNMMGIYSIVKFREIMKGSNDLEDSHVEYSGDGNSITSYYRRILY